MFVGSPDDPGSLNGPDVPRRIDALNGLNDRGRLDRPCDPNGLGRPGQLRVCARKTCHEDPPKTGGLAEIDKTRRGRI